MVSRPGTLQCPVSLRIHTNKRKTRDKMGVRTAKGVAFNLNDCQFDSTCLSNSNYRKRRAASVATINQCSQWWQLSAEVPDAFGAPPRSHLSEAKQTEINLLFLKVRFFVSLVAYKKVFFKISHCD